jgi:hypothetical protein
MFILQRFQLDKIVQFSSLDRIRRTNSTGKHKNYFIIIMLIT